MAEAIFGFVGVIVGALISTTGEWLRARRVDQRERQLAAHVLSDELS